jgi:hypothetical protein
MESACCTKFQIIVDTFGFVKQDIAIASGR